MWLYLDEAAALTSMILEAEPFDLNKAGGVRNLQPRQPALTPRDERDAVALDLLRQKARAALEPRGGQALRAPRGQRTGGIILSIRPVEIVVGVRHVVGGVVENPALRASVGLVAQYLRTFRRAIRERGDAEVRPVGAKVNPQPALRGVDAFKVVSTRDD